MPTDMHQLPREEFIERNLGLVHACAGRFKGRGIEYEELYAAGCLGLVKACDGFDTGRGVCFSTYAVPVILGEIKKLFRDGGTVKVSRSLKELSLKINAERERCLKRTGQEPGVTELAETLGTTPEQIALLLDKLTVKSGSTALTRDTDYTASFNNDGTLNIVPLAGGKAASATTLTVTGKKLDPSKVKAADIVGGVDAATGKETGLEVVRQIYPKLSMTPGILLAPRFSMDATVAAALQAKAEEINGVFKAVCIVDIDSTESGATKYTDVKQRKEAQAVSDANAYAVWPCAKVGEVVYSGSALAAALTAYTDAVNADTPNVSPSNKTLAISAACLADGTEVVLDQEQANTVNGFGVATFLNMSGFRLWGNNTAAYPSTTDPKDRWFSVRRFLSWAANSFILTYFSKVDSPANKRLIEAIVDSENVRGNGFVARGVCARYEVIYDEAENTTADLLDGKITFHQYITPYTPAEDIEDVIEFDPDALTTALS